MYEPIRGDIFRIYIGEENVVDHEQRGDRYCVIIQNDLGNVYSPNVIVALVTSQQKKVYLPTHYITTNPWLPKDSVVLCEQIRTVSKSRLGRFICHLSDEDMTRVDTALAISVGLAPIPSKQTLDSTQGQ